MKKFDLRRCFPPTVDGDAELRWLYGGWIMSGLFSMLFLLRYWDQWIRLFDVDANTRVRTIREGAQMAPFAELLSPCLYGFEIVLIMLVMAVGYHYLSHYLGGRPIYTMKRLPDRFELHRRCLVMPVAGIIATLLIAATLLGLYLFIYYAATPSVCLPADWLSVPGL